MINKTIPIQVEGSEEYARLHVYLWEESPELIIKERPLILICPGGGYEFTSDREADPIASQFFAMGYHVAILRYSVKPAVFPTALLEGYTAIKMCKDNAKEWNIKPDQIYVLGCSAGGHLAASLGMFWNKVWVHEKLNARPDEVKVAGMILVYPVITSGEFAHRGSFEALLAGQYTEEMLELNSLEKQVSEDTPKAFIWHTYTDDCVPVENSLLLIQAMKAYNIPVEFHMYPMGGHGLSTASHLAETPDHYGIVEEVQSWINLAKTWLSWSLK